jgi:formyltetrahydrofolate deformylase
LGQSRSRNNDMRTPSLKRAEAEYRAASGVRKLDLPNEARLRSVPPPADPSQSLAHSPDPTAALSHVHATPQLNLSFTATSATLLLSCPSSGATAETFLSALAAVGARVLVSEQCMDAESAYLFQRIHADISRVSGGAGRLAQLMGDLARRRGLGLELQRGEKKRVAIFVSKYDHCLYDLLLRQRAGELDCQISLVVSNHPDLERVAKQFDVDFEVITKVASNKSEAEDLECALLGDRNIDLIVMARYMQILSARFVGRWERKVINIHHSFLPAFVGAKPYHQAHERGVKLIGATAHYATASLDQGPIIEQDVVRCTHKDTTQDLITKGRDLERQVLARAVRWHLEDRVIVHGNKTVIFD